MIKSFVLFLFLVSGSLLATASSTKTMIFVHGNNGSTEDIAPLERFIAQQGYSLYKFNYEDSDRLDTSANILVDQVLEIRNKNPFQKITLLCHSMGGLVCRRACTLQRAKSLANISDLQVELVTAATPFGGFRSANFTTLPLIGWYPGRPDSFLDLGTRSNFISNPGLLGLNIRHTKIETNESHQTFLRNGEILNDEKVSIPAQVNPIVDASANTIIRINVGHMGVIPQIPTAYLFR